MIKALFSGVSGLKTHQQKMDVIGNNVSNVNTPGYKARTVTFQDVYYQTSRSATAGTTTRGGVNPTQTGYGVKMGSVTANMTRSGFQYSDSVYDLAIAGEGFFQVMDASGNIMYTRAGAFNADSEGNLVDKNGNRVLGVMGNYTGVDASSNPIQLMVPSVDDHVSSATKVINDTEITVSASIPTSQGDITVKFTNGKLPFATFSGNVLEITFNMDKQYTTQADFQAAINSALSAGGVSLPKDMTINLEFGSVPATTTATVAENTLTEEDWTYTFKEPGATPSDPGTVTDGKSSVSFKMNDDSPGAFANNYTIKFNYSSSETAAKAQWDGNVLNITVGDLSTADNITEAITAAAGTDKKRLVECTEYTLAGKSAAETKAAIAANPRLSLKGGSDSFYTEVAKLLSTFKLEEGRIAETQDISKLLSVTIGSDGSIIGQHSVHGFIELGRVDVVTFENPMGLSAVGNSYFVETPASGEPQLAVAGTNGSGEIVSGALEMSNVDLSQEFADMIVTQRGLQANSRVVTTSDTILEELINLKR